MPAFADQVGFEHETVRPIPMSHSPPTSRNYSQEMHSARATFDYARS